MKKIILLLALCLCVGNLFAQDADKLRDEGDAASKAKNYPEALAKYGEYLKATDYKDEGRIFNAGFCAMQAKNYAEAVKYFEMSVKNNYNADDAYIGLAQAYRNLNKKTEFMTTIENGLKAYPDNANMEKLLYVQCMKDGQAAQKANNMSEAEKLFKEVLVVSNKQYKGNALYSLGSMFYGKGAQELQAATPLATSDPDKYKTEKAKAEANLTKAKEYLTEAISVDPPNDKSKKILDATIAALK